MAPKVKVNLADQALISSAADAIQYCSDVLRLKQFEGSTATVQFLRIFDHLFDILNFPNPCATGFKSTLCVGNKAICKPLTSKPSSYICHFKDSKGQSMCTTCRKTGLVMFLVANIRSRGIFNDLVEGDQAPLKYLPLTTSAKITFKYSLVLYILQEALTTISLHNSLHWHTNVSCQGAVSEEKKEIASRKIELGFCVNLLTPVASIATILACVMQLLSGSLISQKDEESDHNFCDSAFVTWV